MIRNRLKGPNRYSTRIRSRSIETPHRIPDSQSARQIVIRSEGRVAGNKVVRTIIKDVPEVNRVADGSGGPQLRINGTHTSFDRADPKSGDDRPCLKTSGQRNRAEVTRCQPHSKHADPEPVWSYLAIAFLNSSVSGGTSANRSITHPYVATLKIGASFFVLMATITLLPRMPARC